jgi:beta-N-acetylhexosaminidase
MLLQREDRGLVLLSEIKEDNTPLAVIFGLSGTALTNGEREFFKKANPLGFILFARNCKTPEQLKKLTDELRDCMGRDVPVLIDQEGGRVMRMKPPVWPDRPPSKLFGDKYKSNSKEAIRLAEKNTKDISSDLTAAGINVNCAPVLDVLFPETHKAIGDRAFSDNPEIVSELAAHVSKSFIDNGVIPVIKHMPGQGRAKSDSHKHLPAVNASVKELSDNDFVPFKGLLSKDFADAVWGMVAHVVYNDIDKGHPSSCSSTVIDKIIRGDIGFDGLLLSDDIEMNALKKYGNSADRVDAILKAGCDIALHCSGKMVDMQDVAKKAPRMTKRAVERYNRSVRFMGRKGI